LTTLAGPQDRIAEHLRALYGEARIEELASRVHGLIESHLSASRSETSPDLLTEHDAILIAYGDQISAEDESPLVTLNKLLAERLSGIINGVHILPFFPYSSDDGFSVIDYRQVDPALGTWDEVRNIAGNSRLMVDAVINHVSAESEWAEAFRRGAPEHDETFIVVEPSVDLSDVVRPRDLPLLTPVETATGLQHVWTTFSSDQFDLNFANPDVLLEILDLLLFYVGKGAQVIRLDAIAYLWKQVGTPSINLPQTHQAIKLMRAVLDAAAPGTLLVTETNVPHEENLSYFGKSGDEADMIYQFALPPLILHTLISGDSSRLTEWAFDLRPPDDSVTFFNFLASHDGIGLRPVVEILTAEEMEALVSIPARNGGEVSFRNLPDGGRSPYELNLTYLDALSDLQQTPPRTVERFLTAHAMMLAMPGVPGIYFHSLFGIRNDLDGVERTGRARSINRRKWELSSLLAELDDVKSEQHQIFEGLSSLLRTRAAHEVFNPWQGFEPIDVGPEVFALVRGDPAGQHILCLHEVAGKGSDIRSAAEFGSAIDLLTGESLDLSRIQMAPYQSRWIELENVDWRLEDSNLQDHTRNLK